MMRIHGDVPHRRRPVATAVQGRRRMTAIRHGGQGQDRGQCAEDETLFPQWAGSIHDDLFGVGPPGWRTCTMGRILDAAPVKCRYGWTTM
jgi:hypothetical protein